MEREYTGKLDKIGDEIKKIDTIALLKIVQGMCVERWKEILQVKMSEYRLGDRVEFNHRGRRIEGTVNSINEKSVSIRDDQGGRWRVSPSFLSKVMARESIGSR